MKWCYRIISVLCCFIVLRVQPNIFQTIVPLPEAALSFKTTNTWFDFGPRHQPGPLHSEKCILTSLITFRCKKVLNLKKIQFLWKGERLDKISAVLYSKREKAAFMLIEKNMISDGMWDAKTQQLVFNLNEKLVAKNTYYLVLNIPFDLEKKLRRGSFTPLSSQQFLIHNFE